MTSNNRFTPEQVAALSGLTTATVMRYIRRMKLKAKRSRCYSIEATDVREFLLAQATTKGKTVE
jgi:hypothetical protein